MELYCTFKIDLRFDIQRAFFGLENRLDCAQSKQFTIAIQFLVQKKK